MTGWKTERTEKEFSCDEFHLYKDDVTKSDGSKDSVFHLDMKDEVLIVPVINESVSFILSSKYKYLTSNAELQFPTGNVEPGEGKEAAARRIMKHYANYEVAQLKFMYSFYPSFSISSSKIGVYLADVNKNKIHSEVELDIGFVVKEINSDQLMRMVRENEITDGKTLAALATVLLQSPKALDYAKSLSHEERENEEVQS